MWYVVVIIASVALSIAIQKRPQQPKPAVLTDFDMPQAEEGTPQTVIFGDCWSGGWMVLSYGALRNQPIKSKGKK